MNFENIEEIKNILMDFTPLYKDVINNITPFLLPRFEEGKYYGEYLGTNKLYDAYKIARRTRHYITIGRYHLGCLIRTIRQKIYLDDEGEYIKLSKRNIIRASHYLDIVKYQAESINKRVIQQLKMLFDMEDSNNTKDKIHFINAISRSSVVEIRQFKWHIRHCGFRVLG